MLVNFVKSDLNIVFAFTFIISCRVAESIHMWEYSVWYRLLSSPGYAPMQTVLLLLKSFKKKNKITPCS